MGTRYFQTIILYCLLHLDGERTIASAYHILKGKKSSQTIQDIHLFQLSNLFQIIPDLERQTVEQTLHHLVTAGMVVTPHPEHYVLTNKGAAFLKNLCSEEPIPKYINGWTYHRVTTPFWERLSLLVQVCSHFAHQSTAYVPIQRNMETRRWVKAFLQKVSIRRTELAKVLSDELIQILEHQPQIDPRVLVFRFTGYKQIGWTREQAATKLQMEPLFYSLQFLNVLHYMIMECRENKDKFPILATLCFEDEIPLTESTRKTLELFQSGKTLEQIMAIRKLKKGTIEDHFTEIAFHDPQFDVSLFVCEKRQREIINVTSKIKTKQLRKIKQLVPEASYFEIRLVLAKYGDA